MDMDYVRALARERAGYAQSRPARVIAVDEELARLGWCVASGGGLVRVDANRRAVPAQKVPTVEDVEAKLDAAAAAEDEAKRRRPRRERRPQQAPERVVED